MARTDEAGVLEEDVVRGGRLGRNDRAIALHGLLHATNAHHYTGLTGNDGRGGQADTGGGATSATGSHRREANFRHTEHLRQACGVKPAGIVGKAIDITNGQAGILHGRQDGLADQFKRGLRQGLAPLVVRRGANANDRRLVLDRSHRSSTDCPPGKSCILFKLSC
ncbi:hypothetical protein D3C78_915100 [compost metagenome]